MWLHRENEYEWKYIGVWLDMLPEEFCNKIKLMISDCEPESIFLPFYISQFPTPIEMIQLNLRIRNSIPAVLDVNDKKQIELQTEKITELEKENRLALERIICNSNSCSSSINVYLNSRDEFRCISFLRFINRRSAELMEKFPWV